MSENDLDALMVRIAALPGAHVDVGFAQGEPAIRSHLNPHFGSEAAEHARNAFVGGPKSLEQLRRLALPYFLPDDYISFLSYYGGLLISGGEHTLSLLGIGPMAEEWYGYVLGDDAIHDPGARGYLRLGQLIRWGGASNNEEHMPTQQFDLALCLGKKLRKDSVIATGPHMGASLLSVMANPDHHSDLIQHVGTSFAEFLKRVAATTGLLLE